MPVSVKDKLNVYVKIQLFILLADILAQVYGGGILIEWYNYINFVVTFVCFIFSLFLKCGCCLCIPVRAECTSTSCLVAGIILLGWSILNAFVGLIRYVLCYRTRTFYELGEKLIKLAHKLTDEQFLRAQGDCAGIHAALKFWFTERMGDYVYFMYVSLILSVLAGILYIALWRLIKKNANRQATTDVLRSS